MDILVFTGNKLCEPAFKALSKAKDTTLAFHKGADAPKALKQAGGPIIAYIDISTVKGPEKDKIVKALTKMPTACYGIIDPKGTVTDVAEIFHSGAADYIGKDQFKKGITALRIKRILTYCKPVLVVEEQKAGDSKKKYIYSGSDWKGVTQGKEYTFTFMLIELDNLTHLKNFGKDHFNRTMATFHQCVADAVAPSKGKVWMWMDFGGLILFPFDGKKCDAIIESVRLLLNRALISTECFEIDILLSFRIALHIGTTMYKSRGDTGTIVSDSINSVFHLGQKFAEPGSLYLTEEIQPFIPEKMRESFVYAGDYEGRNILRMRRLL